MPKALNFSKIREEITEARDKYDHKTDSIKGVHGLSKSDMDTILLYVDEFEKYGPLLNTLMKPRGKIKEVLDRFKVVFEKDHLGRPI